MKEVERWREPVSAFPTPEALAKKREEGWRLAAIEWERASGRDVPAESRPIPYGLRISADCRHLEVDPTEKKVVATIIAMIAGDHPLSRIASELNHKGFRTRSGSEWTQLRIFQMLPRVIELGPEILSASEWSDNKRRLLAEVS
ncbi:MAG: recombinase family protein [Vicinamibacteria bacterium]